MAVNQRRIVAHRHHVWWQGQHHPAAFAGHRAAAAEGLSAANSPPAGPAKVRLAGFASLGRPPRAIS
jgi:hypothetical protein